MISATGARLSLEKIAHRFQSGPPVLDGIDLQVAPGEFVALLGPSGCGKSTLLRMIAGLEKPAAGHAFADSGGRDFFRGFVFQEAHLLPWRTAAENVALPLELMGKPKAEALKAARAALSRVELADAFELYPNQLSGGMKMRVSVARAIVSNPTLLLFDEPFAALDETVREKLQEDLRRLWRELGSTIVFVTHSVAEAVFLADRAVMMAAKPGRIISDLKINLAADRGEALRQHSSYWKMVGELSAIFRRGHA